MPYVCSRDDLEPIVIFFHKKESTAENTFPLRQDSVKILRRVNAMFFGRSALIGVESYGVVFSLYISRTTEAGKTKKKKSGKYAKRKL